MWFSSVVFSRAKKTKKTRQHCGCYAGVAVGGAAQIELSTRSQRDLTVTVREAEGTRFRLDDVDLHTLQARQAIHVDLVVGVSDVPHDDFAFPRVEESAGPDPNRAGCSKSGADARSATAALLAPLRGRAAEGRAPTPC